MKQMMSTLVAGLVLVISAACTVAPTQVESIRTPASTPPAAEQLEVFSSPGLAVVARNIDFSIAPMADVQDLNCATLQDGELHQEFNRGGYPAPGSAVVMKNTSTASILIYLFGHVEFHHKNDHPFIERYFFPKLASDVSVPSSDLTGKYAGKVIQLDPGASASFVFPLKSSDPTSETFVRLSCKTVEAVRAFQSFGYGTMIEWNTSL